MPRIANVNLLGVLLAAVAIYFIGFIWYGLLFAEPYMNAMGIYAAEDGLSWTWLTSEGVQSETAMESQPLWMLGGILIPVVLAVGLAWHLRQRHVCTVGEAMLSGFLLSLLIGAPLMAYGLVYSPWHAWAGFLVDASHTVASFVVGSAVIAALD